MKILDKMKCQQFLIVILLQGLVSTIFADTVSNPCGGDTALLSIVDRPTVADSACVVPLKKALLETGYQYQSLSGGHAENAPEGELRIGLPAHSELAIILPNTIHQSLDPHSGWSATTLGLKHEIGYNAHWLGGAETLFTLPSGSRAFGSHGLGATVNGIVTFIFNPTFDVSLMLGGSTATQSSADGGNRYWSANPDLIASYTPIDKINLYAEVYGQTKTSPTEGSGFNVDGGVLYLLTSHLEMDLEVGQNLRGNLGGFDHYFGVGLSVMS